MILISKPEQKIAFDRLMGSEKKYYKRVRRPAEKGEWVQINFDRAGYSKGAFDSNGIYKVLEVNEWTDGVYLMSKSGTERYFTLDDYVVLEGYEPEKEKTVIPHLEFSGMNYGQMGSTTNYKDAVGRPLYVGDVVKIYDSKGKSGCYSFIVDAHTLSKEHKQFVMGIESCCDDVTGKISNFYVLKHQRHIDVPGGYDINGVKCVR